VQRLAGLLPKGNCSVSFFSLLGRYGGGVPDN